MGLSEMDARLISQGTQVESVDGGALIPVATAEGQPQGNITLENLAGSLASAVPAQQTEEQVSVTGLFAKTEDGKMVELTKESVASVVAGIMGNPVGTKGYTEKDMNGLVANGIYYCHNASETDVVGNLHYPTSSSKYWLLNVSVTAGLVIQTAYRIGNYKVECYSRDGDTAGYWSSWARIDNFGYNSLAELSAEVAGVMGAFSCFNPVDVTDFNTFRTPGMLRVNGLAETSDSYTERTLNAPIGAYKFGTLIVLGDRQHLLNKDASIQVYIPDPYDATSSYGVFIRKTGFSWRHLSFV